MGARSKLFLGVLAALATLGAAAISILPEMLDRGKVAPPGSHAPASTATPVTAEPGNRPASPQAAPRESAPPTQRTDQSIVGDCNAQFSGSNNRVSVNCR